MSIKETIKEMEEMNFLRDYVNAYSPVAQEWEGQKVWTDYVKNYVDYMGSDNYGTVYGVINNANPKKSGEYKVVIEAHCDEISWIITYISEDGLIHVARHGGSDSLIAPSKKVLIHTRKNGKINGVFGYPAIHTRDTGKDTAPKPSDLIIDTGFDTKEAVIAAGIEVTNLVTFEEEFSEMGDYYVGKSLDNKIGGYIIAQVAKRLKDNKVKLPYDLYVVNSVQEEVGLMGARNIARELQANVALVHDVCHSTNTPGISKIKNCDVKAGKGPTLEYCSQNHRKLLDYIRETAEANEIEYQLEVGSQGNDTMAFFFANTVTAIISSPLKYMHTTCEMVHKNDVERAIELFYQCLVNMKPQSWKYYDF